MSIILFICVHLSIMLAAQIKVACIGNSITYGYGSNDQTSYPSQLSTLLRSDWEVKNFGIPGATMLTAGDFPYSNQQVYNDAISYKPDVVIIKLGTNDSKAQNWKHKDEFISDFNTMVSQFKALPTKPIIIVCLPVPTFQLGYSIQGGIIRHEIMPMIKLVARQNDLKLINLFKPLRNHPEWFVDGIHPNSDGSKEIAKIIARKLIKCKSDIEKNKQSLAGKHKS